MFLGMVYLCQIKNEITRTDPSKDVAPQQVHWCMC